MHISKNWAFGLAALAAVAGCAVETDTTEVPAAIAESAAETAPPNDADEAMTEEETRALAEDEGLGDEEGEPSADVGDLDDGAAFDTAGDEPDAEVGPRAGNAVSGADRAARACSAEGGRCGSQACCSGLVCKRVSDGPEMVCRRAPPAPILMWGIHQRASDGLRGAGVTAARITQTIGNAPASGGFHKQDGTYAGKPYTTATDISTRGLSTTQIKNLLERLGKKGFAAWYRQPGADGWPSSGAPHIHAVYANAKMKASLRAQVKSWIAGRNGLSGNAPYRFYAWSASAKSTVRAKFSAGGSGTHN